MYIQRAYISCSHIIHTYGFHTCYLYLHSYILPRIYPLAHIFIICHFTSVIPALNTYKSSGTCISIFTYFVFRSCSFHSHFRPHFHSRSLFTSYVIGGRRGRGPTAGHRQVASAASVALPDRAPRRHEGPQPPPPSPAQVGPPPPPAPAGRQGRARPEGPTRGEVGRRVPPARTPPRRGEVPAGGPSSGCEPSGVAGSRPRSPAPAPAGRPGQARREQRPAALRPAPPGFPATAPRPAPAPSGLRG